MAISTHHKLNWKEEYEIGINVIDAQHRRIVEYINELIDIDESTQKDQINVLISSLIDYTYSHFAFEEALMEEAGYEYLSLHQKTHKAFTDKIDGFHQQFQQGEKVAMEICEMLQIWLINHIMEDDRSYSPAIKKKWPELEIESSASWLAAMKKRFFQ